MNNKQIEDLVDLMFDTDMEEVMKEKSTLEYINKLQQENKQLKEQLEYLRSNEYLNQVKWERNFNEELVKDLQDRIDKAIEILHAMKHCELLLGGNKKNNIDKLLEILGVKENED